MSPTTPPAARHGRFGCSIRSPDSSGPRRAAASRCFAGSVVALIWVNVFGVAGYESVWHTQLDIGIGDLSIDEDLGHWINDGLMTLFFFLISLEIKREIVHGDLRRPRQAALPDHRRGRRRDPAGDPLPRAHLGTDATRGWGIPMATDAAFAIAALAMLGERVGVGAKLFLVTIAVVDDVAAILVIAVAYTSDLSLPWLARGARPARRRRRDAAARDRPDRAPTCSSASSSGSPPSNRASTRRSPGVALAFLTPARPINGRNVIEELEDRIHPWTSFLVLPLFALANAGVELGGDALCEGDGTQVARRGRGGAAGRQADRHLRRDRASPSACGSACCPQGVDLRSVIGDRRPRRHRLHRLAVHRRRSPSTTRCSSTAPRSASSPARSLSAAIGVAILAPGGRHPSREWLPTETRRSRVGLRTVGDENEETR